ncbi:hypothetical protein D3C75_1295350 [compost metagenome]
MGDACQQFRVAPAEGTQLVKGIKRQKLDTGALIQPLRPHFVLRLLHQPVSASVAVSDR